MRKKPTFKQKAFSQEYVKNKGNGTRAALEVYDTEDYGTANQIAIGNLQNPIVNQEINRILKKSGVTLKRAARATADGLDEDQKIEVRMSAARDTYRLLDVYPRRRVTDHRHAHLHLSILRGLEKLSDDELERIIEENRE